jgi:adenylosuccinate synthase
MRDVVVVGAQWGDEGKGKIVDWLAEQADVVVRFQGGHNAGHTLVIQGVTYKLSLLPSGIVRPNTIAVVGNGVVVDPYALQKEVESVRKQSITVTQDNLIIADNCPIILSLHREYDLAVEEKRGDQKIGTTGRGIGPAYEDKVGRRAIRLCDLADVDYLSSRVLALIDHHNLFRQAAQMPLLQHQDIMAELLGIRDFILPFAKPLWRVLRQFKLEGKKILYEGAQGSLLDIDHGTYPFVTSSTTAAAQAFIGSGSGLYQPTILGITKAYATRVGSGPFPTELHDHQGELLGQRGHEFGTVTGRKRRCGWLDAVLLRQMVDVMGINQLALTKLDVLDCFESIKIAIGYEVNGQRYDYLPALPSLQNQLIPIYEIVPGWQTQTVGIPTIDALPLAAQGFIRRIEQLCGVPISIVSTSPEREHTICHLHPFE